MENVREGMAARENFSGIGSKTEMKNMRLKVPVKFTGGGKVINLQTRPKTLILIPPKICS